MLVKYSILSVSMVLMVLVILMMVVAVVGEVDTFQDSSSLSSSDTAITTSSTTIAPDSQNIFIFYPNIHILKPENNSIFLLSPESNTVDVEFQYKAFDIPPVHSEQYYTCIDLIQNDVKLTNDLDCLDSTLDLITFKMSTIGKYELFVTMTHISSDGKNIAFNYSTKHIHFTVNKISLELSRIVLIQQASLDNLQNRHFLEFNLLPSLGFNCERLQEQPEIVRVNGGGFFIWQYPNQFAPYLLLIQSLKPTSYLEVGCRWGGTFVLTVEYLKRFGDLQSAIAVDVIDSPVQAYTGGQFFQLNSTHAEFQTLLTQHPIDMIFIDGDHTYDGVKADFLTCAPYARIVVFHDIVNYECLGVAQFWYELKLQYRDEYDFYEFVDQYPEVIASAKQLFLGIGVAVKKTKQSLPLPTN